MTIEMIERARDISRKEGNKARLLVLNDIIATVRKAETAGKKKVELTEAMVDEALIKYRKMLKDGIKQMPENSKLRETYEEQLNILMEFCPVIIDGEVEIKSIILVTLNENKIPVGKKSKGLMMKALMPVFKSRHVDTEIAMPIIDELIAIAESTG
jgi:hypothetical protein